MTTGIEMLKQRKPRGPSKKPTLVGISLRLPKEVIEYFNANYPYTKQAMMRAALTEFISRKEEEELK
jgi:hypothetical protein